MTYTDELVQELIKTKVKKETAKFRREYNSLKRQVAKYQKERDKFEQDLKKKYAEEEKELRDLIGETENLLYNLNQAVKKVASSAEQIAKLREKKVKNVVSSDIPGVMWYKQEEYTKSLKAIKEKAKKL